jgi:hypothetical protein
MGRYIIIRGKGFIQAQGAQLWKGKRKRGNFLTGHIQCKQSVTKKLGIEGEFPNAQMIIYLRRH